MYHLKCGDAEYALPTMGDVLATLNRRDDEAVSFKVAGVMPTVENADGTMLQVVCNDYGRFGVVQPGDCLAVLTSMIDEVDQLYVNVEGQSRQPWQMERGQWQAVTAIGSAAYNSFPCFTAEQRAARLPRVSNFPVLSKHTDTAGYMCQEYLRRFGYDHCGPLFGPDRESNSRHEVHVAYALAEGKPVPEIVLQPYHDNNEICGKHDVGDWFLALLQFPQLRGTIPVRKLTALVTTLRGAKQKLTADNASTFIALMGAIPVDAPTIVEIDDFLYENGMLPAVRFDRPAARDLGVPFSPLAAKMRLRLGEHRRDREQASLAKDVLQGRVAKRYAEAAAARNESLPDFEPYGVGNSLARAVSELDIEVLLDWLDSPEDSNTITKRVVFEEVGLKTFGVKAEERRQAIFAFCGFDAAARAKYELEQKQAAEERVAKANREEAERRITDLRYWLDDGNVIPAKQYVDDAVKNGFSAIYVKGRGNSLRYWLWNPLSKLGMSIRAGDGTLDYAKLCHGLAEQRAGS